MRKDLRIFISSPGDVQEERLRAHLVVQKLARDYQRFFRIQPYLWEYEPMLASGHFQDAIEPPSHSDIVVLVVYSRLGTALPEHTAARAYRGIDGRTPVTGTEWEFEEALEANRDRGAPDLLAYRKLGDPQASLADPAKRAEQERQWDALEGFWRRHFEGGGVFLAGSSKFKALEEFDAKLEADLVRLIEARIAQDVRSATGGGADDATWLHGSPFQGLAAYDFHDSPIFFGRDAEIRQASTRLQAAAGAGTAFLLILGASGSGKSSLARAGLLPALFAAKAVPGVGLWRRVVLRPAEGGGDPVLALAQALVAGDPADGVGLPELTASGLGPEALAAHLQSAPDDPSFPFRQALATIANEARSKLGLLPHEEARLVLLVDQIEELFTRDLDPGRRELFVRILTGLARSGVVWVVATMRNDLWHRAAAIPAMVGLVESGARLDVHAPGGAEIIEIVRRPAAAAGLLFENDLESGVGLDAAIARAASEEPGALPLLSVMLHSLFARDIAERGGRALTFASYRDLGELKGAIARRADDALAELGAADPEAAAALPRVLRALVTASGDGTATSRPARLDGFPAGGPEARLVEALLAPDKRLLVASDHGGVAEVRLAHEALLENWPSARDQIAADRRDLQTRARLETLQRRWSEAATPAERKTTLLASLNLAEGVDLARRWGIPPDDPLGAYVGQSQVADRWRRRRFAVAASILVLIFAGIAGLASLQWRRAEQQAALARAAEATERDARASADEARNQAVGERDRADAEKARALAALRDAKRSAARTLAVQAELAAGRSEIHRSLSLAVEAAEAEAGVLDPGERSASEPALLRALAEKREVLHLRRPAPSWHAFPNDFLDETHLVYADGKAGVMIADLATGAVRRLAGLPENVLPLFIRSVPSRNLVAMTSWKTFFAFDARSGIGRAAIPFPDRVTSLDVSLDGRTAAIGTGSGITFIDLDAPVATPVIPVPAPRDGYVVGQVRFAPDGRTVLVGYGADILRFDRDAGAFVDGPKGDLAAALPGIGRDVTDTVSAKGVTLVEMRPDPDRKRLMMFSNMELVAIRDDGTQDRWERDTLDAVLGLDVVDINRQGSRDLVATYGRPSDAGLDMRLVFVGDDTKPLRFESFRVAASDLGTEKLKSCRLSPHATYLACTYDGKSEQGVFVFTVLGGKHRGSEIAVRIGTGTSAVPLRGGSRTVLSAAAKGGLLIGPGDRPVSGVTWDATWRLVGSDGVYAAAVSSGGQVQVLAVEAGGTATLALAPVAGTAVSLRAGIGRALVGGPDRLVLYDLKTGRPVWTLPGLAGLKGVELSPDGTRVVAATAEFAYLFDGRTGRMTASYPMPSREGAPLAVDAETASAVFVSTDGAKRLDLASGEITALHPAAPAVVQLTYAPEHDVVVLGLADGSIVAVGLKGERRWTVSAPSRETFEVQPWPGQPPRGTLLHLVASPGGRLAVIRQDMPDVALYSLSTGQYLTELTTPRSYGVPSTVAFDGTDAILTLWANHPMVRTQPVIATLHALPLGREAGLRTAKEALAALAPRSPDGAARPLDGPRQD